MGRTNRSGSHAGLVPVLTALAVLASGGCTARRAACDPLGTVSLPKGQTLCVEVADTPLLRARGYMFRDEVKRGEGMVFLMESNEVHPFWMKNCLVALDILWLDENWRIVHIAESVPPCPADPCPSFNPMRRSLYILEVGAGESSHFGLKVGDTIRFEAPIPPSR